MLEKNKELEKNNERLTDPGDTISVHLNFKKNLGNYQNMEFGAGVSVTQRDGEAPEEVWQRAWQVTEDQLDSAVDKAMKLLENN